GAGALGPRLTAGLILRLRHRALPEPLRRLQPASSSGYSTPSPPPARAPPRKSAALYERRSPMASTAMSAPRHDAAAPSAAYLPCFTQTAVSGASSLVRTLSMTDGLSSTRT